MARTAIVGFPRVGADRELKWWTEDFFKGKLPAAELLENAARLRRAQWTLERESGLDFVPSNDFSFYDGVLDTAVLFGAVPKAYRELGLDALSTYFAMARGYQGDHGDVHALAMKKWFNTNYHYIVPVLEDDMALSLTGTKPFDEFTQAKELGLTTKPVLVGPFTFLKLADCRGSKRAADFAPALVAAYTEALAKLAELGAEWVQLDEPSLVTDLTAEDLALFTSLYKELLAKKGSLKLLLQTYFGDIRDAYKEVTALDFDGFGLDFLEGKQTLSLIKAHGFPKDALLFAGVVNGKNIWRNDYERSLALLRELESIVGKGNVVVSTSCSLLHVPYTLVGEDALDDTQKAQLSFAVEKLGELEELGNLLALEDLGGDSRYQANLRLFRAKGGLTDPAVKTRVEGLSERDFTRLPAFAEREEIQRKALGLPLLPTTTIGSFPQTKEVKSLRTQLRKGELSPAQYKDAVKTKIAACVKLQEEIGIDVLVHGEFERGDMVEHFGEHLKGFLFTKKAWVQSYGTRCVKPPVVWSDVSRAEPITVEYSAYAQSLTKLPLKGMLTGPVTILNWSFPREDISSKEMAFQIGLAIREEVLDLEAAGVRVIQIDEAALKEKLPIRRADWNSEYLDWAIPAFRLTHSGVKAETQIHTHMCYSEFADIVRDIDAMDADVISFEASRSNLSIVDALVKADFRTQVGPGVYDIHSPRIPSVEELVKALHTMLDKGVKREKLWVNPDCGLKTRGEEETIPSLQNLVAAAKAVRG